MAAERYEQIETDRRSLMVFVDASRASDEDRPSKEAQKRGKELNARVSTERKAVEARITELRAVWTRLGVAARVSMAAMDDPADDSDWKALVEDWKKK